MHVGDIVTFFPETSEGQGLADEQQRLYGGIHTTHTHVGYVECIYSIRSRRPLMEEEEGVGGEAQKIHWKVGHRSGLVFLFVENTLMYLCTYLCLCVYMHI